MDVDKIAHEIYDADPSVQVAEVVVFAKIENNITVKRTYTFRYYPGSYEKLYRWSVSELPLGMENTV